LLLCTTALILQDPSAVSIHQN